MSLKSSILISLVEYDGQNLKSLYVLHKWESIIKINARLGYEVFLFNLLFYDIVLVLKLIAYCLVE